MSDKYLMTNQEWQEKYQRKTNKCENCGKHYRMPTFIHEPRNKICFTCEVILKTEKELKNNR